VHDCFKHRPLKRRSRWGHGHYLTLYILPATIVELDPPPPPALLAPD